MCAERSIELHRRIDGIPSASLGRWAAGAALGLLICVAVVIAQRRLAGALENPLEVAALLSTGLLAVTAAGGIRVGWHSQPAKSVAARADWTVMLSTSAALIALGAALSTAGTQIAGLAVFWTLLAAEEGWAWYWFVSRRVGPIPWPVLHILRWDRPQKPAPHAARVGPAWHAPRRPVSAEEILSEDVTQQLMRSRAADGAEELSGWLRPAFAAGQRTGSIHVAFCPPFAGTPELAVEQIDGPEARIKTAQLLPYGVRLDLKLAAAAEQPTTVLLQFSARTVREKTG